MSSRAKLKTIEKRRAQEKTQDHARLQKESVRTAWNAAARRAGRLGPEASVDRRAGDQGPLRLRRDDRGERRVRSRWLQITALLHARDRRSGSSEELPERMAVVRFSKGLRLPVLSRRRGESLLETFARNQGRVCQGEPVLCRSCAVLRS